MAHSNKPQKNKRIKRTTLVLVICIVIALISLLLPPLVNHMFINAHFETGADLGNSEWLGFWGSYLGGVFSSSAALIALYITISQQEHHHSDSLTSIRLNHLPIPTIDYLFKDISKEPVLLDTLFLVYENDKTVSSQLIITEKDFRAYVSQNIDTHLPVQIEISNIGNGAFIDLTILNEGGKPCSLCSLAPGMKANYYFAVPVVPEGITLKLQFSDMLGNIYSTTQEIVVDKETDQIGFLSYSAPVLEKMSETFKISGR